MLFFLSLKTFNYLSLLLVYFSLLLEFLFLKRNIKINFTQCDNGTKTKITTRMRKCEGRKECDEEERGERRINTILGRK